VTSDRIGIRGIRGRGFHGVLEQERREGQEFVVDVDLWVDLSAAAGSDDLTDTVDYAVIAESVLALIEGEPCQLIETLAQRIASAALANGSVQQVEVTVHKPKAPISVAFDDVSVTLVRSR